MVLKRIIESIKGQEDTQVKEESQSSTFQNVNQHNFAAPKTTYRVEKKKSSLYIVLQHNSLDIHHPSLKDFRSKARQTIQQILGCVEITAYQHFFCRSIRTNAKLCEVFKDILARKMRLGEFETVALT